MYAKFFKRFLDFFLSLIALTVLFPLLVILTVVGAIAMRGNPFFTQLRPGKIDSKTGKEKIFRLIKFRTMSNQKDKDGKLLPDELRLNKYGRFLRSTSLDELPELWNILKGDMSIVGPRPLLVCDCVFMTEYQCNRHNVLPGLTGLAQVNGRNNIAWDEKIEYDLQYINRGITFIGDIKIIFQTIGIIFTQKDVVRTGTASDIDFGDWLMMEGRVDKDTYNRKKEEAQELLSTRI